MAAARRRGETGAHSSSGRPDGSDRTAPEGVVLRPAGPGDDSSVLDLLSVALGWQADPRHRALFDWKHRDNPFGPSPCWVAVDADGIVGVRIFMRWRFIEGHRTIHAVRAVDTATHPRARGRGVFRALTLHAVDELSAQGVDWVFNTPNAQSLGGYLSMGWRRVGRLPVAVRPAGVGVAPRLAAARVPADLWSLPTSAGEDAAAVLAEAEELSEVLASQPADGRGVRSDRSPVQLQWRYGAGPMGYRALLAGSSLRDGVVFFRLRRRGQATEVVIADSVVPRADAHVAARLARRALEAGGGDYAIALGSARPRGWIRLPRIGPLLTWRGLADASAPPIGQWKLSTGDIELF